MKFIQELILTAYLTRRSKNNERFKNFRRNTVKIRFNKISGKASFGYLRQTYGLVCISAGKKVKGLSDVVVATDDERIVDVCKKYDMNVIMTSDRHKTPNDRVWEVSTKTDADIYVCINGDEPLIEPKVIERSFPEEGDELEYFYSNVITTIENPVEVVDPTNIKAVVNAKGDAMWASRSPIPYPKRKYAIYIQKDCRCSCFFKKGFAVLC